MLPLKIVISLYFIIIYHSICQSAYAYLPTWVYLPANDYLPTSIYLNLTNYLHLPTYAYLPMYLYIITENPRAGIGLVSFEIFCQRGACS